MEKAKLTERHKSRRLLSAVPEKNKIKHKDGQEVPGKGHKHKVNEKGKQGEDVAASAKARSNVGTRDDNKTLPIEIDVHGLKAKVYLNCADVDIVPARYLEKAGQSPPLKRRPWVFRTATNGRTVNLDRWPKMDTRYQGVFKALRKVPQFTKGLFENDTKGRMASESSSSKKKFNFEAAAEAQGQVVYALLDEILAALKTRPEAGSQKGLFFLRSRLLRCQPEYWTGYRMKHRDTPFTAGVLSLVYEPEREMPRAVTQSRPQSLHQALEGSFKLLLAQLLVHIHRLSPPGDKLPDQETFLITLHGSRLHILRGLFPGQKTSLLWCGRYNPPPPTISTMPATSHNHTKPTYSSTHNLLTKMSSCFYQKLNLQQLMEQIGWSQLSNPEIEASPRRFQILGSREYDLWNEEEFSAVVRLLTGLIMYLMSGTAQCGILQDAFNRWPFDEE
ncbi:hypothetical protein BJX63DRAFT_433842 [Aspergillus granulosus]|uniref:Uncharacterized protein n=1 Tax=Aspergillus granulosus TaxID=176169 RepID=A0ABR4H5Y5_9EURO